MAIEVVRDRNYALVVNVINSQLTFVNVVEVAVAVFAAPHKPALVIPGFPSLAHLDLLCILEHAIPTH
jgi:hypothetical protein